MTNVQELQAKDTAKTGLVLVCTDGYGEADHDFEANGVNVAQVLETWGISLVFKSRGSWQQLDRVIIDPSVMVYSINWYSLSQEYGPASGQWVDGLHCLFQKLHTFIPNILAMFSEETSNGELRYTGGSKVQKDPRTSKKCWIDLDGTHTSWIDATEKRAQTYLQNGLFTEADIQKHFYGRVQKPYRQSY